MNDNQQNGHKSSGQQTKVEKEAIDPVNQNIETVAKLHKLMESDINDHQRAIETVTAFFGRPVFLYFILSFVILWVTINIVLLHFGLKGFDPTPFTWLMEVINLGSLLLTTVVLITQHRQNKATEQRRHLDLQVNLLVEQKVTKLIVLIEELRKDLPLVDRRHDPEIEALKESVDPHEVLSNLNQMLKETTQEGKESR